MSVVEDSELEELVKETLEKSGSLPKIRAELRASVFLALSKNGCFEDKPREDVTESAESQLLMFAVDEWLAHTDLNFTRSVFRPELQSKGLQVEHIMKQKRTKLLSQLSFRPHFITDSGEPLLLQMLNIFKKPTEDEGVTRRKLSKVLEKEAEKEKETETEYVEYDKANVVNGESTAHEIGDKSSDSTEYLPLENSFPVWRNERQTKSDSEEEVSDMISNEEVAELEEGLESMNGQKGKSFLADLPPLSPHRSSSSPNTASISNQVSKSRITDLKAMLNEEFNAGNEDKMVDMDDNREEGEKESKRAMSDDERERQRRHKKLQKPRKSSGMF